MSANNDTIIADVAGYSQDDLVDIYEKLAECYRRVKQENENIQQETFHLKQQNSWLQASQNDLQNELETINVNNEKELKEVNRKHSSAIQFFKVKNHEIQAEKIQQDAKVDELTR